MVDSGRHIMMCTDMLRVLQCTSYKQVLVFILINILLFCMKHVWVGIPAIGLKSVWEIKHIYFKILPFKR